MRRKNSAPKPTAQLRELIEKVDLAVRRTGAQSVMTSAAIAERFGLHTTDLECLDLIYMRGGAATAGDLAKATGLSTGATTALIDRLERAGYVERVHDAADRRRVNVRIRGDAVAPIQAVYEPMQARMFELWSRYTPKELEIIADFLTRSGDVWTACVEDMRRSAPVTHRRRESSRR